MSADIVERLNTLARLCQIPQFIEAADEITRLREQLQNCRATTARLYAGVGKNSDWIARIESERDAAVEALEKMANLKPDQFSLASLIVIEVLARIRGEV